MMHKNLRRLAIVVVMLWVLAGSARAGTLRLAGIFGHGMVFQRDIEMPVWGWGTPGAKLRVELGDGSVAGVVKKDGTWMVRLKARPAGGPYVLRVESGEESVRLLDVKIGEVWVCSGQSNMEWNLTTVNNAGKEISAANWPDIRVFKVPNRVLMTPADDLEGNWFACKPSMARQFSAVAYFFGRALHQQYDVPVGLIVNPWSAQPIEPFISRDGYKAAGVYKAIMQETEQLIEETSMTPEELKAEHDRRIAAFKKRIDAGGHPYLAEDPGQLQKWFDPRTDISKWGKVTVPGRMEASGNDDLVNYDGTVWMRFDVDLPAAWAGQAVNLELAPVDDLDITYFNGTEVGRGSGWNVPRSYKVPGELINKGKNTIVIRVVDTYLWGGVIGTPEQTRLVGPEGAIVSLAGEWSCRTGLALTPADSNDPPPPGRFGAATPTAIYNAMVAPVIPYAIRGAIWYQGESNATKGFAYRRLMRTLIRDWRAQWGQGDFPFLWVQLANFNATPPPVGVDVDPWPELREAQLLALEEPNTAMAVAIDIGEGGNVHPRNKQDVGARLALAARAVAYDEDIPYSGPVYTRSKREGDRIRLRFEHVAGGLVARDSEDGSLRQFYIAGKDRKWVPAQAKIDEDSVLVWAEAVPRPEAVRYAWLNNPEGCNLYNDAGLPASPFRTDKWPLNSE